MTERRRALAVGGVHLFVLSAFALAQPLFDILGRTPEFFVVRGSRTLDIVVLGVASLLLVPLALVVVELAVGLVSMRAARAVHLGLVAALSALIAMQVLKRLESLDGRGFFAAAAAVGIVAAAAYALVPLLRTFVLVLSPAPVVFLVLFLLNAPLRELASTEDAFAGQRVPIAATAPVVVVVFDELPTSSLMDERRRIDPVRYPNFASLAADATWFRNATTVHEHTTEAVPAILTGRDPEHGRLPLVADHPRNLFTLLGSTYGMQVFEPVTQLCPGRLCPRRRERFGARMTSLGEDLAIVYGHVVLPDDVSQRLPSVSETWQDFGEGHADEDPAAGPLVVKSVGDVDRAVGRQLWRNQRFQFEQYAATIRVESKPSLYFVHALLPHSPWRYLPSGRQYGDAIGIDGIANDRWIRDEWLVTQGYQRHLLQVGFVDRLLGTLLRRLRATGLYDRSLIVVVADHGVSFVPGERRRAATPETIQDIASVPLLVKKPRQRTAAIVDRGVRTTDVVPTIAEVLGVRLPWRAAGRSLFARGNDRASVRVQRRDGKVISAAADDVARRRDAAVAHKAAIFGSRGRSVFAIGSPRGLLGRRVGRLTVVGDAAAVELDGESLLRSVDRRSALVPSYVRGHVDGALSPSTGLAVALNGRIAALTRTFEFGGQTRFAALVPESAFRDGANDVQVYALGERGGLPLRQLRRDTAGKGYRLTDTEILAPGGRALPITPGALQGKVEDWYLERETVRFGGWAGDVENARLVDRILVYADDELLYAGRTSVGRLDLAERYPGLGHAGFVFELPRSVVEEDSDVRLRFFAIRGGTASELGYKRGFPWR